MSYNSRQMHKFVKDAVFTPDGGSAINLYGIVRVEPSVTATTNKTQVANCEWHDDSITQVREFTIRAVFQDVEKWNSASDLYEGLVGSFACKNEAHTSGASDETHTWDKCKITSIDTSMAAGEGPQEITMEMEVYPSSGTASPFTKA